LQFKKLRDWVMNVAPSSRYHSSHPGHRSVLWISMPSSSDISISSTLTRSYKEALLGSVAAEPQKK
jgi:hypothetical protein